MADITAEMAVQEAQVQETAELETTDYLVLNDLCQNIFNNWGIQTILYSDLTFETSYIS